MSLTKEELLKPRYKVVADYPRPHNHPYFGMGEIIEAITPEDIEYFNKYKALFQPLPWWSDRKPEDMPEYVRYSEYYLNHYHLDGEFKSMIFKVDNWSNGHYGIKAKGGGIIYGYEINFEPANESEYTAYISQKQQ